MRITRDIHNNAEYMHAGQCMKAMKAMKAFGIFENTLPGKT